MAEMAKIAKILKLHYCTEKVALILNTTFTNNSFTINKYMNRGPKLSKLWFGLKMAKNGQTMPQLSSFGWTKRPKWDRNSKQKGRALQLLLAQKTTPLR